MEMDGNTEHTDMDGQWPKQTHQKGQKGGTDKRADRKTERKTNLNTKIETARYGGTRKIRKIMRRLKKLK